LALLSRHRIHGRGSPPAAARALGDARRAPRRVHRVVRRWIVAPRAHVRRAAPLVLRGVLEPEVDLFPCGVPRGRDGERVGANVEVFQDAPHGAGFAEPAGSAPSLDLQAEVGDSVVVRGSDMPFSHAELPLRRGAAGAVSVSLAGRRQATVKAKGKRQRAKGKSADADPNFCLLVFAFCPLP